MPGKYDLQKGKIAELLQDVVSYGNKKAVLHERKTACKFKAKYSILLMRQPFSKITIGKCT